MWISSSHPPEKKATFELSSIWSLSNVWPCPENSTGQPPGAFLLFLQRLMKGYLMSFNPASDLSEKRVFCNPRSKIGCWESEKVLNETSCKVCMPFQGNQASQAGNTKTQNPEVLFDVSLCSLHVMTREVIIRVKVAFYWMPWRIVSNEIGVSVSLIVCEYDLNLQVFSEPQSFTRAWEGCNLWN